MKGTGDNAGEQRAVVRWGMRRLVFVSIAMVFCMLVVALSTDMLTFFSGNTTAQSLIRSRSSSSPSSASLRAPVLPFSSSFVSTEASQFSPPPLLLQTSSSIAPRSTTADGCNYTKGRWVKDEKGPLYSGRGCKRWLSGMWACRLMPSRPNFNYENYRWQPDGCDLPAFNRQEFLARMRNKVVAFVGDSIGRQQFQSLMCMLTGGEDNEASIEDISKLFGLVKPRGAIRADGLAQRFTETNTTVLYYWSASLCELQPLDRKSPDTKYAMHLDRPATFIQKYLPVMDVLVLNTGHHWNRGKLEANKWVMYVNGRPNTNRRFERDVPSARSLTIPKVAAWLHEQKEKKATHAEIYIRTLSPRHFFDGDWDSGGRCDGDDFILEHQSNVTGLGSDPVVEDAVSGTNLRVLGVTYASQFRYDAHISKYGPNKGGQDCLHWCLPGVPDLWNELLYADLLAHENTAREA